MDVVTGLVGAPLVPPLPGQVRAYYGTAASCIAYNMSAIDYAAAKQNPDGALWSSAPQSTTKVYNRTYGGGTAPVGQNGARFLPTGTTVDDGTYFGGGGHGNGLAGPLSSGSIMDM